MKAVEFDGTKTPSGEIALPPEIAAEIPAGEQLRVVVMWDHSADAVAWRATAQQQFESSYSPDDAVYEQLMDDPQTR